jgi:hypothetical protein
MRAHSRLGWVTPVVKAPQTASAPLCDPTRALVHAATLSEPGRSARRVWADYLPGRRPRGPEPVHPGLVDVAARAVPRAVTAHDGQRHRGHVPDRVLDVVNPQRRARALLSSYVPRHARARKCRTRPPSARSPCAPQERRVDPAGPGPPGGDALVAQPRGQGNGDAARGRRGGR